MAVYSKRKHNKRDANAFVIRKRQFLNNQIHDAYILRYTIKDNDFNSVYVRAPTPSLTMTTIKVGL